MRFVLPLLIILTLTTCGSIKDDDMPNPSTPEIDPTPSTPIRYLALGDSYTIGESVEESDRWPNQLAQKLRDANQPVREVKFVATTGWTTNELAAGMDETTFTPPYDLVSLLIGVNDQYRGQDVANYYPRLANLLDRAVALAGGDTSKVFVVSIPDYAYTPYGAGRTHISNGVNAYNAVKAQLANAYGIPFVDITPISRRGLDQPNLVAEDGLHPSGPQYRLWVEEKIRAVVMQLID